MKCLHDWSEISRVHEESTFEKLANLGISEAHTVNEPAYTVLIIACKKCGAIKKYRV
jgi:hypothetical protein